MRGIVIFLCQANCKTEGEKMKKWTGATLFALGLTLSVSGIGVQKQNAKADEIAKNGN